MCGRFTNRLTWREIMALYRLTVPAMSDREGMLLREMDRSACLLPR